MTLNQKQTTPNVKIAVGLLACMFTVATSPAYGQTPASAKPMTRLERADLREAAPLTTFHLKYALLPNDGNEILTGLRLMLDPAVKLYFVPSENAIVLKGLPEEVATAMKLIGELDVPRKEYRLIYTLTETDNGKRMPPQHITLQASAGQRVVLKQGNKIPVITGKFNESTQAAETQMTYLDVGLNFDATLSSTVNGAEIKSRIERSSVIEDKPSASGVQDPSIRQTLLDNVTYLPLGKQVTLGSLDLPDGTHRMEVEVKLEMAP